MEQIINILLGAGIASIVPIITLMNESKKWKIEKRIEILRIKHDRLEVMYTDILSRLNDAILNNSWPSDITSKLSVYGSKEAWNIYFDFVTNKGKDESNTKSFYLDMCLSFNKHLVDIQDQIEKAL